MTTNNSPRGSRLIPAHAGSTYCTSIAMAVTWAHPRSRGEHGSLDEERERGHGSSPLTRGARLELPQAGQM